MIPMFTLQHQSLELNAQFSFLFQTKFFKNHLDHAIFGTRFFFSREKKQQQQPTKETKNWKSFRFFLTFFVKTLNEIYWLEMYT